MILPSLSFIVLSGLPFLGEFAFAFRPSSTRRRMASERPGPSSWLAAQASTAAEISGDNLTALTGYTPPFFFGRPIAFLFTEIDFFIVFVY
jgi:hypothetical protein